MSAWPFRKSSPLSANAMAWTNSRMKWLGDQFGMDSWRKAKVVEPTSEFFPDQFDGSDETAQRVFNLVAGFMGVDPSHVVLQLFSDGRNNNLPRGFNERKWHGPSGLYGVADTQIVAIETSNLADPLGLVATIAHELAHVRLLGEKRLTGKEPDHEPLTDLTTVFFGLGIFNANTTFRYSQWADSTWYGWRARRLGYLDERMFGYALGLWAMVRGEDDPSWTRHLQLNPRTYVKQTIRYLKANPPVEFQIS